LQRIIFGELNGDHPLTYEEAFAHEQNLHKKLKVQFIWSFDHGVCFEL
jgi:hypothetical protein